MFYLASAIQEHQEWGQEKQGRYESGELCTHSDALPCPKLLHSSPLGHQLATGHKPHKLIWRNCHLGKAGMKTELIPGLILIKLHQWRGYNSQCVIFLICLDALLFRFYCKLMSTYASQMNMERSPIWFEMWEWEKNPLGFQGCVTAAWAL